MIFAQSRLPGRYPSRRNNHRLAGAALAALWTVSASAGVLAADCPPLREPRLPPVAGPADPLDPLNIGKVKTQLNKYHAGNYDYDVAAVLSDARIYLERRAKQVARPAVVLDIDETSLTNWPNLKADDYGFLSDIKCDDDGAKPCGFSNWVMLGKAAAIAPTLDFFNAAIADDVAVFFVTGRRESQRDITASNLERAKFKGWTSLLTRPDDDQDKSIVPFKSGQRNKIEQSGYTIIANVGDQLSDLAGGHAECTFKVPNPFYFIE
jgi:acid phosphatase